MKKVLIISSSPRMNGNSDTLCNEFMAGAKEAGHEVKKIRLQDYRINYCIGCMACIDNGGHCVQKDDMAKLLTNMAEADVIVLATPVYFYTMCGQMKTFIDRCCPAYMKLANKQFYTILTAAEAEKEAMQPTVLGFQGFFDCLDHPSIVGTLYGLGNTAPRDVQARPEMMKEAYIMGHTIH